MSSSTSSTDFLEVGRVGRPHGLDGSFHVTHPRPSLLTEGASVTVDGAARRIERRAGTDERPIVRLAGCASREDAEALRGRPLLVARGSGPPLGDEEWWPEDLVGCRVHDAGRPVGAVARVTALPSCDVLEVARGVDGTLLVPLVRDAVRSVDVGAKSIDVDLGFVEGG